MHKAVMDVAVFHRACDMPVLLRPIIPPPARKELRWSLIDEEVNVELAKAMEEDNLPQIADAIADSIYVLIGTALEYGIPLSAVWAAVQATNMAKVDPVTEKVKYREDGKVLKPDGWTPPDIKGILDSYS